MGRAVIVLLSAALCAYQVAAGAMPWHGPFIEVAVLCVLDSVALRLVAITHHSPGLLGTALRRLVALVKSPKVQRERDAFVVYGSVSPALYGAVW